MKRAIALTVAVSVLGAGGAQTAQAVEVNAGQDNIGAVEVAWADATNSKIRITWTEATPVANVLSLATVGSDQPRQFGSTPAGGANEFLVDKTVFGHSTNPAIRHQVIVGDPASDDESRSDVFDNFIYFTDPRLTFAADNTLHWQVSPDESVDGTPGDPLDRPKAYLYTVTQRVDDDPGYYGLCKPIQLTSGSARTGVLPNVGQPYNVDIGVSNEWGTQALPTSQVATTASVSIVAPATTPYGTTTTITGNLTERVLAESGRPPSCAYQTYPLAAERIILQARTSSTAAWATVATGVTNASGNYSISVTNRGLREYRVVRPNTADGHSAAYGGASAGKVVRSSTRVMSAKFINPVINYGAKPQAYLWVEPAGTQRAALQFKNASGNWQGVQYKTLYAGRGLLTFPWNRRGITQFRWWVPAFGGADAIYTGPFTLTVR